MFSTFSLKMQNRCSERKHFNRERIPGSKTMEYFFYCLFSRNVFQPYLLFTPALKNLSPVSLTFL